MKTIEMVRDELLKLSYEMVWEHDELHEVIREVFGDYEYEGQDCVIVSEEGNTIQAYVNHEDAPILIIKVEYNEYVVGISDVWIY